MAITEIFVDPGIAGDSGSGTRMTVTLVSATFTFSGLTLNETNVFTAYNTLGHAAGDRIYVDGGTNVNTGWYGIASITSNSEIVLDADITSDSSSPTDVSGVSVPYGDLKFAIEQYTFDLTNGLRVNVKTGTDEVLTVEDLAVTFADTGTSIAWVPTDAAHCLIQGYTTIAGDGGKGGISGNGARAIIDSTSLDSVHFRDMHLHNCGSAEIIDLDRNCSLINCELDNTSGLGISLGADGLVFGCHLHNIGGHGVTLAAGGTAAFNYFENGANDFNSAINAGSNAFVFRNIIKLDGASNGIASGDGYGVVSNSIWCNAGTGKGILMLANTQNNMWINNIVEGFSGSGGIGFDGAGTGVGVKVFAGNAAFDNTTDYVAFGIPQLPFSGLGDNEVLGSSAFTDATNGDFAPVDIGNVKEGALPQDFGDGQ